MIDVWGGDGKQTRSFMYVGDCIGGPAPPDGFGLPDSVNLDSGQTVTVDELVRLVAEIAPKVIGIRHNLWMSQGAPGCNSDNALSRHVLKWEPQVSLAEGLTRTYAWIARKQLAQRGASVESHPRRACPQPGRLPEPHRYRRLGHGSSYGTGLQKSMLPPPGVPPCAPRPRLAPRGRRRARPAWPVGRIIMLLSLILVRCSHRPDRLLSRD